MKAVNAVICAWVIADTTVHAANIAINYQSSQYTGYSHSPRSGPIFTTGGNVTSLNFNDTRTFPFVRAG
ncbi:MAG: hypothetical protein C5B50_03160 [Verrucomicrobia bacterium]|nr:MAG: hypothetical protein C5B50_03160 [Verrucomicrobiota bacterium]